MKEEEKYWVEQLAKSVTWRLGCQALFGKELSTVDEIEQYIREKGKEVLLNDRLFKYPLKADTFEDFCEHNITIGIGDELLTKQMIVVTFEKELRNIYEKTCSQTDN